MNESDLNFRAKINIFIEDMKIFFYRILQVDFFKQIMIPLNIGNKILQ